EENLPGELRVMVKAHGTWDTAPLVLECQTDSRSRMDFGNRQCDKHIDIVEQYFGQVHFHTLSCNRSSNRFGLLPGQVQHLNVVTARQFVKSVGPKGLLSAKTVVSAVRLAYDHLRRSFFNNRNTSFNERGGCGDAR